MGSDKSRARTRSERGIGPTNERSRQYSQYTQYTTKARRKGTARKQRNMSDSDNNDDIEIEMGEMPDNLVKKTSTIDLGGNRIRFSSRASVVTRNIMTMPEMPRNLASGLQEFEQNCKYKTNSIYDFAHLLLAKDVFLGALQGFTLYLSKRATYTFPLPVIWLDSIYAAVVWLLIRYELIALSRVRLSKFTFYRALTKAGVIIDFDNEDLYWTLKLVQMLMYTGVLLSTVSLIFGRGDSDFITLVTVILLIYSSAKKMISNNVSLENLEAELLSLNMFVEQDVVWARGCFTEFQVMTTSEALYRWMKINIYQRQVISQYLARIAAKNNRTLREKDLLTKRRLPLLFQLYPRNPMFAGVDKATKKQGKLTSEEIEGLNTILKEQDLGFRWEYMRRRDEEPPYGHVVVLKRGTELPGSQSDNIEADIAAYEQFVGDTKARSRTSSFRRRAPSSNGSVQRRRKSVLAATAIQEALEPAVAKKNDDLVPLAIQKLLYGRQVSPQNLNDLRGIVADYPAHLAVKALKETHDNLLLALANIVQDVCGARRTNGSTPICEGDKGEEEETIDDGDGDYEEEELDDEEEDHLASMTKIINSQEHVYMLNKNWWELDNLEDEDECVVWIFVQSGQGVNNELFDCRTFSKKQIVEEFFEPCLAEKKVREEYKTARVEKLLENLYFPDFDEPDGDGQIDIKFAKKADAGMKFIILGWVAFAGYLFAMIILQVHSTYFEGQAEAVYKGYCGNDHVFLFGENPCACPKSWDHDGDTYEGCAFTRDWDESYTGIKGSGYRGEQSFTASGRKCVPWADVLQWSVDNNEDTWVQNYINDPSKNLVGNVCRNPDTVPEDGIWCYTDLSARFLGKWGLCNPLPANENKWCPVNETCTLKSSHSYSFQSTPWRSCYGPPKNTVDFPLVDLASYVDNVTDYDILASRYVYYNTRFNRTKDNSVQINAIGCHRACKQKFGYDSHYIGTLQNSDQRCMCSASNCSKDAIYYPANFTTYNVSYEAIYVTPTVYYSKRGIAFSSVGNESKNSGSSSTEEAV